MWLFGLYFFDLADLREKGVLFRRYFAVFCNVIRHGRWTVGSKLYNVYFSTCEP